MAVEYHVGLVIAIRVIMGAFHACVHSALFALYTLWFPKGELASANAALAFGGNLGLTVAFPLAGYLCEYGFGDGWPSVFYVVALAHVPWIIFWVIFVTDSPQKSLRISGKELEYILTNVESSGIQKVCP